MSLLRSGIKEEYPGCSFLYQEEAEQTEIYLIKDNRTNKFVLIWGDYVANVWNEEFDLISTALGRMATLWHVIERDEKGETIGLKGDWTNTWARIATEFTHMIEKQLVEEKM